MTSVLEEISVLRKGAPIVIDYRNSNRYRLLVKEEDGSRTAYCFGTPIYNIKTRKLADIGFHNEGKVAFLSGSNADIRVYQGIVMENSDGWCRIDVDTAPNVFGEKSIKCNGFEIIPTINGVAIKSATTGGQKFSFDLEVNDPFLSVRENNKCFSLMKEKFQPLLCVSCIGSIYKNNRIISPSQISYNRVSDKKYNISVSPATSLADHVLFEINMYEPKLIRDTTVESLHAKENNAFGGIAFVGKTEMYGEQWLYSCIDSAGISDFADKYIVKAVLHLPEHNYANTNICLYRVSGRFCSFGSNWENKVCASEFVSTSTSKNRYQDLDITSLAVNRETGMLSHSDGFILRLKAEEGFSAVSTCDSYYAPQILEINYI